MPTALIFDLDNTLLPCDHRYTECNDAFGVFAAETLKGAIGAKDATARFKALDLEAAQSGRGFGRQRFPTVMRETLTLLGEEAGVPISESDLERVYAIGARVFTDPYDLYPGVTELLDRYRDAGVKLALCTKGDPAVQNPLKIDHNGLRDLFDVVRIFKQSKGAPEIAETAAALGVHTVEEGAFMIGDSIRDDIVGGRKAGLGTVLITGVEHAWDFNSVEHEVEPDHAIGSVTELPSVLPVPTPRRTVRR